MTIVVSATHNDADAFREVSFSIRLDVPDRMPLEQIEASAKNLLDMVEERARAWDEDDGRELA